jgi:hypothetical protein
MGDAPKELPSGDDEDIDKKPSANARFVGPTKGRSHPQAAVTAAGAGTKARRGHAGDERPTGKAVAADDAVALYDDDDEVDDHQQRNTKEKGYTQMWNSNDCANSSAGPVSAKNLSN